MLVDGPLVFNLAKSVAGGAPFDFLRGEPLRFGVVPRYGGADDVVWIDAECCFAYHGAGCDCGDGVCVCVCVRDPCGAACADCCAAAAWRAQS